MHRTAGLTLLSFLSSFNSSIFNMTFTKYPAKQHWAKVAKNLGLTEGLVYLKGDVLKERHDTDVVSSVRESLIRVEQSPINPACSLFLTTIRTFFLSFQ